MNSEVGPMQNIPTTTLVAGSSYDELVQLWSIAINVLESHCQGTKRYQLPLKFHWQLPLIPLLEVHNHTNWVYIKH